MPFPPDAGLRSSVLNQKFRCTCPARIPAGCVAPPPSITADTRRRRVLPAGIRSRAGASELLIQDTSPIAPPRDSAFRRLRATSGTVRGCSAGPGRAAPRHEALRAPRFPRRHESAPHPGGRRLPVSRRRRVPHDPRRHGSLAEPEPEAQQPAARAPALVAPAVTGPARAFDLHLEPRPRLRVDGHARGGDGTAADHQHPTAVRGRAVRAPDRPGAGHAVDRPQPRAVRHAALRRVESDPAALRVLRHRRRARPVRQHARRPDRGELLTSTTSSPRRSRRSSAATRRRTRPGRPRPGSSSCGTASSRT